METQSAPPWIRDKERGYDRFRRHWMFVRLLLPLVYLGCIVLFVVGQRILAAFCLVSTMVSELLRPYQRARRYEDAANILRGAIRRYELNLDPQDRALAEADRQASAILRHDRKRVAPRWIRATLRQYRLELLLWIAPVDLLLLFLCASALWHWTWIRPWHTLLIVGVFIPTLLVVLFAPRTKRLQAAKAIVSVAIERYEFEAVEDELILAEANRQAAEALRGAGPESTGAPT